VKEFWGKIGDRLPVPEIQEVGATFAESECRHSRAYSHLLEILGLNNEFEGVLEVPAIKKRVNYAQKALAKAKGCKPKDITVCVLERPRHQQMIDDIRGTGAAVFLITDGDIAAVMHCAESEMTGIDMYMGLGGAPEGVLAAGALKCMGGQIWGRLTFRNDEERARAAKAGITDLERVYARDDMVTDQVIIAATGVTDGSVVSGLKRRPGYIETETILMRSRTGSLRRMIYRSKRD